MIDIAGGISASSAKKFEFSKDIVSECEQAVGDLMALRSVSRHKNKVEVQSVFKFLCLEPPGNSKNEAYGKRFFSLLHLNEMLIHFIQ